MEPGLDRTEEGWWRRAVVYQIYPRSFADSDGDGVGDLRGIIGRLDYLAALGVDVLWLSPVYRSPQDDNGYDISDYEDVDPLFGTLDDMDELIAEAHARGLAIVMDLVVNHTSDEHPWFVASRRSVSDPRRDWYWWRPPRAGHVGGERGAEPTLWQSYFSGPGWAYDEATGEYYLHLFSRKQPDLNWENPAVREAVYAMMRWWRDRGVDGFRMDVINLISKPVSPDGSLPDQAVIADGPRMHEFLAEMQARVLTGRDRVYLTVGEMPGVNPELALAYTDPARHELDMVFTFEHMALDHGPGGKWDARPFELPALKASMARWQDGLAQTGWNSLYWDNHDQPRALSRWGDDAAYRVESAKTLLTTLHLHRGTPYVYQGDELGMTNAPFTEIGDFADIESLRHYAARAAEGADLDEVLATLRARGRDNARTPMQWDGGWAAGFTTGTPWLGVNPNHVHINAAAAMADDDSVWHHLRRLIALRHTDPVVADGSYTLLLAEHDRAFVFTRRLGDDELLVVANWSSRELDLHSDAASAGLGQWATAPVVLATHPLDDTAGWLLAPWESRVYRR